MQRYDFVDLGAATVTPEGWVRDRPVLTRTGVFEYRRADGTVQREYRPADEVFAADALASLRGVPVTDDHPGGPVTAASPARNIGAVLSGGEADGESVRADVVIHNPARIGAKREPGCG